MKSFNPQRTTFLLGDYSLRILHTADVHLQVKKPETLETLSLIVKLGKQQKIDLLTIAGDLFDSPKDANALRIPLRNLLSDLDFHVLVIPGNHDVKAFDDKNLDYGSSFHALVNRPIDIYTLRSASTEEVVNIVGVPFKERVDDDLLTSLKSSIVKERLNILLLHCTLDIAFSNDDFGENEREYFSINKSTLRELGYDIILAGHFHSQFEKRPLSDSCLFVYPGSPISLTWKEIGMRAVALVDTQLGSITSINLQNSYYRDIHNLSIGLGKETEALHRFHNWANNVDGKKGDFRVRINGIGELGENDLIEQVNQLRKSVVITSNEYRTVGEVLGHSLYQLFNKNLEESSIEDKEPVRFRAIEALGEVIRGKKK